MKHRFMRAWLLCGSIALAACGGETGGTTGPDSPDAEGTEDVSVVDTIPEEDTAVPDSGGTDAVAEDATTDADEPDTEAPDAGEPDVIEPTGVPRAIAFSGAGGGVLTGASTRAVVGIGAPTPAPVARGASTRLILGPAAARP